MAREPKHIVALRRALGERLATFRQAAGLKQAELARATFCHRTNIAHIEGGRARGDLQFWQTADELVDANGALLAAYSELEAAKQDHELREREARLAKCRQKAEGLRVLEDEQSVPGSYVVESHKFVPAFVGADVVRRLASMPSFGRFEHEWLEGYVSPVSCGDGACNLYAFACGVTVFHIRERCEFPSVTSLAAWRRDSYQEALRWTTQQLGNRWAAIDGAQVETDYVLSLYCLEQSPCAGAELDTALRLMCVPSALIDRKAPETNVAAAARAEQAFFRQGFAHPDLVAFGVQGASLGYASWSGVSYHPLAPSRALSIEELVACELTVQSLWCYCHHIATEVEEGRDPAVPAEYSWRFLRAAHSRLTAARAQETSQHCLMRDAILATSRLPQRLKAAQEVLCEDQRLEGGLIR